MTLMLLYFQLLTDKKKADLFTKALYALTHATIIFEYNNLGFLEGASFFEVQITRSRYFTPSLPHVTVLSMF